VGLKSLPTEQTPRRKVSIISNRRIDLWHQISRATSLDFAGPTPQVASHPPTAQVPTPSPGPTPVTPASTAPPTLTPLGAPEKGPTRPAPTPLETPLQTRPPPRPPSPATRRLASPSSGPVLPPRGPTPERTSPATPARAASPSHAALPARAATPPRPATPAHAMAPTPPVPRAATPPRPLTPLVPRQTPSRPATPTTQRPPPPVQPPSTAKTELDVALEDEEAESRSRRPARGTRSTGRVSSREARALAADAEAHEREVKARAKAAIDEAAPARATRGTLKAKGRTVTAKSAAPKRAERVTSPSKAKATPVATKRIPVVPRGTPSKESMLIEAEETVTPMAVCAFPCAWTRFTVYLQAEPKEPQSAHFSETSVSAKTPYFTERVAQPMEEEAGHPEPSPVPLESPPLPVRFVLCGPWALLTAIPRSPGKRWLLQSLLKTLPSCEFAFHPRNGLLDWVKFFPFPTQDEPGLLLR